MAACDICGGDVRRKPGAGRPPKFCPDCRDGSGYQPEQYAQPEPESMRRAGRPTFGTHPLVADREPGRALTQREKGIARGVRGLHVA